MRIAYTLVRLRPLSPFHLGARGIGLEETETFIHSDTLFSALCNAWVRCHGTQDLKNRLLQPLPQGTKPPLRISSAFPYAFDTPFFARPLSPLRMNNPGDPKPLKRGRFVSGRLFVSLLSGNRVDPPEVLHDGDLWVTAGERQDISEQMGTAPALPGADLAVWILQEVPRVSLDRVTQASNIFYFSRVTFAPGCGLFFLAVVDPPIRPAFETVVRVLGDTGIGGDRTAGYGQFEPGFEEVELDVPEDAETFLSLSLLSPSSQEIEGLLGPRSAYGLVRRDGWIDSPQARNYRRRACRMFAEGSVFRGTSDRLYGRLVDVTPTAPEVRLSHPIYRYGYAFPIPILVQKEGV